MVALNWFICCCNELISSCQCLVGTGGLLLDPSDRNPSKAVAKAFALRTASAFVGPATLIMSTLSLSTVPGALPSNVRRTEGRLAQKIGRLLPDRRGLQECQSFAIPAAGSLPGAWAR